IEQLRDVVIMERDEDDRIWLSNTRGKTGYLAGRRFHPFALPDNNLQVHRLAILPQGVFFGTDRGLYRFDHASDKLVKEAVAGNEEITGLTKTAEGELWIGTREHTYLTCFEGGRLVKKEEAAFSPVTELLEDASGNRWMLEAHRGVWL